MPRLSFQVHVNFVLSDPLVYPLRTLPHYATTAASYLYAAGIMQEHQ